MSKVDDKDFKKYKHKSLYSYASTEWMNNSTKKYRRVFNSIDTTYVYAEFSFFNKLFDGENWTAKVKIICTKKENNQESQVCDIAVDKEEMIDRWPFFYFSSMRNSLGLMMVRFAYPISKFIRLKLFILSSRTMCLKFHDIMASARAAVAAAT